MNEALDATNAERSENASLYPPTFYLYPRCLAQQIDFLKSSYAAMILFGERGGTRTLDPMIKSHVLYRLSYALT
jgi:hypothetical protein